MRVNRRDLFRYLAGGVAATATGSSLQGVTETPSLPELLIRDEAPPLRIFQSMAREKLNNMVMEATLHDVTFESDVYRKFLLGTRTIIDRRTGEVVTPEELDFLLREANLISTFRPSTSEQIIARDPTDLSLEERETYGL